MRTFWTIVFWLVIVGILAAIAMPNYIKAGSKGGLYNRISATDGGNRLAPYPAPPTASAPPPPAAPSYPAPSVQTPPGMAPPNGQPYDSTYFQNPGTNPFFSTEDQDTSTFGMDVDTASYVIARRFLFDGNMPDPNSVRTEEFINYFDQNYPEPADGKVFSLTIEGAESEFGRPNYHLLRIGVKARDIDNEERPAANMIFVVDRSGSMQREDRLEQVKRSLTMLAGELRSGDRIGLVTFNTRGQVVSEPTSDHDRILWAIQQLRPEGTTNAADGLRLAYDMARRNFEGGKINRIVLCSDGVANTWTTNPDQILAQVGADAANGITLTTIGFGMGNYNDVLLERLADHGDGSYYYLDSEYEAQRLFSGGAVQLLVVSAYDAKVQVQFNAETVDRYRLLGYENRTLNREDFKDNSVDAGEVGSGQTVTALYEIRIKDGHLRERNTEVATVRVRYKDSQTKQVESEAQDVKVSDLTHSFGEASEGFRLTAAVAEFAEILKKSDWAKGSSFADVLNVAQEAASSDEEKEFVNLVVRAKELSERQMGSYIR